MRRALAYAPTEALCWLRADGEAQRAAGYGRTPSQEIDRLRVLSTTDATKMRSASEDAVLWSERVSERASPLEAVRVVRAEAIGQKHVYDVETERHHTLFANGFAVHNCHELRHPGSAKYMGAKFIADNTTYRLGLTGTPIFNEGGEMHAVMECIRPGELGESSEFNREWCEHGRVKDPKAFGFFLRETGLMLRRTRKDVKREIPPVSRCIQKVDCDTSKLDDITNAAGELAKIILAQSEVQGAAFRAAGELDGLVRQATGIAKAAYCAEFIRMLADSGEKVLVYAWHRTVYDILKSRLRAFNPVLFTGTESASQKQKSFDKFASGESQVMLMSLRAGQGLDGLQKVCRTVVFAELDWAHGVHIQCEGRVARDQQEDPVVCYYLVADEGSDPIVVDVLGLKRDQLEGIIDPDKDLLAPVDTEVREHIKKLAAAYLAKQAKSEGEAVFMLGEARARKQSSEQGSAQT